MNLMEKRITALLGVATLRIQKRETEFLKVKSISEGTTSTPSEILSLKNIGPKGWTFETTKYISQVPQCFF